MITLYHAPMSRSSRIVTLIDELGADVAIREVTIPRQDGSGGRDPANPHPEGKVPLLDHDGAIVWETPAIILYLTDLFPAAGLGPLPGDPQRGTYLSWLSWYGGVVEPILILESVVKVEHPVISATFRSMAEVTDRLARALEGRPYLMGEHYTAADLLLHSPFAWFPAATPDVPAIGDWVRRCQERPAVKRTIARDTAAMAVA